MECGKLYIFPTNNWGVSLVPAAAVSPALKVFNIVIVVKKFVFGVNKNF